jgi:hypothetical protein
MALWAIPSSKGESPMDTPKDFKKSLEEETEGEYTASIDIIMCDSEIHRIPLFEYRFYVHYKSYGFIFLRLKQQPTTNALEQFPVQLTVNYFQQKTYSNIQNVKELEEKLLEVTGSDETGYMLEHIKNCQDMTDNFRDV